MRVIRHTLWLLPVAWFLSVALGAYAHGGPRPSHRPSFPKEATFEIVILNTSCKSRVWEDLSVRYNVDGRYCVVMTPKEW
jgi:hypothetical protein